MLFSRKTSKSLGQIKKNVRGFFIILSVYWKITHFHSKIAFFSSRFGGVASVHQGPKGLKNDSVFFLLQIDLCRNFTIFAL